ncbi:DUF2637 domain-containing protein [Prauserella marina]|uniref:Uncharacterized protein n=1 Tax=Prauserella marina TaxID=530584 RepID=A0A222VVL9_9PSEU|nr:DUF2637 domain-containing protein [Prauserella marina]ASR37967.1 DUF2637 domain-containing protein [Prauserella marina]PWV73192.1 uncharacterized protein DUF2637 [Prauserella marina]SDD69707.1 Protein of unknown function [Prauserella marina]
MSTPDSPPRASRLVDTIRVTVAVILGGIGAAAGFTHTHEWASHHGQTGWLAWATAIVIEGMVVVAGFEVQRDHRTGTTRKLTFPMAVLVAGFGVQMAAQVALAEPSPAGWLVAAMPALGFLVVVKLLMRRTPQPTPAPDLPAESPTTPSAQVSTPVSGTSPRLRLPAPLTARLDTLTTEAQQTGRVLTTDDIRQALKVPEDMAARILADLAPRNGHPIAT